MTTNGLGLPLTIELTGGEASDYKGFDLLFDTERPMSKVLIANRGYDVDRIREDIEATGGSAVIPGRQSGAQPIAIDRFAYRLRNRIERTFGRMKKMRAVWPSPLRSDRSQLPRLRPNHSHPSLDQTLC